MEDAHELHTIKTVEKEQLTIRQIQELKESKGTSVDQALTLRKTVSENNSKKTTQRGQLLSRSMSEVALAAAKAPGVHVSPTE